MLSPVRSNRRRLFCLGLATLFSGSFLPAMLGEPAAGGLRQRNLVTPPSFEEDRRPLAPARYSWRNSGFVASFEAGGSVLLSSTEGTPARLSFPGAASSDSRGEGRTVEKGLYYIGPDGDWRAGSHFERVRYAKI